MVGTGDTPLNHLDYYYFEQTNDKFHFVSGRLLQIIAYFLKTLAQAAGVNSSLKKHLISTTS